MSVSNFSSTRTDVYIRVTAKIITDLESGVRTWLKPWSGDVDATRVALPLRHNGVPYRGINVLLLWSEAIDKGYTSQKWMTYRQAGELGGHVRKGEHGSPIAYVDNITRTEENDKGEEVERDIPFMKLYTVFNVGQIEGLDDEYYAMSQHRGEKMSLIAEAEQFFDATRAIVRHGGSKAYYAPGPDVIQLPEPEAFRDAESYAAVKAHELTHWTSHTSRLAREFGTKRFGDDAYAMEELVAEIGAAFLCVTLGITPEAREDHSSYVAHWLKVLKDDKRAIFTAAAHGQRAVDYLSGLQESRAVA
jgi:antirestriction protein ArdC